jgi:hypothetical protein
MDIYTCFVYTDTYNEDDIEDSGISRNMKIEKAKASLANVESLLQQKHLPNHIIDLSRLADQEMLMKKNLMILEVYIHISVYSCKCIHIYILYICIYIYKYVYIYTFIYICI